MKRVLLAIVALVCVAALFAVATGDRRAREVVQRVRSLTPLNPPRVAEPPITAPFDGTIPAATASSAPVDPPPRPPRVRAGASVTIELSEPPATWYMRAQDGGNEQYYRRLVRDISGGNARFSADLGRAAREFVFAYTELGREPPSNVRDFLTRSSGAVAGDTSFRHVRTTSDKQKSLRAAIKSVIEDPPDGAGVVVVGIGEIFTPGAKYRRHIGVVATRLGVELDPTPRQVELGGTWRVAGRFLESYSGLQVLAMGPDGEVRTSAPQLASGGFVAEIPVGNVPGSLDVQLVGVGPNGPGKLFQVRAEVGRPLPDSLDARLPPDERGLRDAHDAAALAFSLLNADRKAHNLGLLRWDDALAEIATSHSRDMRDSGFFAHRSPTTGLHSERMQAAGYRSVSSAENLAHNVSVWESERGLMASLGHRRNILSTQSTHVGVGVVGEERPGGGRRWWVTQLFSKPAVAIDPDQAVHRLVAAIGREREKAGLPGLIADVGLSQAAAVGAESALDGGLDGASARLLTEARTRGLLRGKMRAWAATTPELERLKLPELVRARAARRLGVGVVPARGDDVSIGVALLVGD